MSASRRQSGPARWMVGRCVQRRASFTFLCTQLLILPLWFALGNAARAEDEPSFTLPLPRLAPDGREPSPSPPAPDAAKTPPPPEIKPKNADLTLGNFWSAGWNEPFVARSDTGHAARIQLFHTHPAFFVREMRMEYDFFLNNHNGKADVHEMAMEMEVPWNRRFLTAVDPAYLWRMPENGEGTSGPVWSASAWAQFIDTPSTAANFQLHLLVPEKGDLHQERTHLTSIFACFQDLGNRFGLQTHVGLEARFGDNQSGEAHYHVNGSAALTRTFTDEVTCFSYFTVFVEAFGGMAIDHHFGRSTFSFLPGMRWEICKSWWIAGGVEVPVTAPHPFDVGFRVAMSKDF